MDKSRKQLFDVYIVVIKSNIQIRDDINDTTLQNVATWTSSNKCGAFTPAQNVNLLLLLFMKIRWLFPPLIIMHYFCSLCTYQLKPWTPPITVRITSRDSTLSVTTEVFEHKCQSSPLSLTQRFPGNIQRGVGCIHLWHNLCRREGFRTWQLTSWQLTLHYNMLKNVSRRWRPSQHLFQWWWWTARGLAFGWWGPW